MSDLTLFHTRRCKSADHICRRSSLRKIWIAWPPRLEPRPTTCPAGDSPSMASMKCRQRGRRQRGAHHLGQQPFGTRSLTVGGCAFFRTPCRRLRPRAGHSAFSRRVCCRRVFRETLCSLGVFTENAKKRTQTQYLRVLRANCHLRVITITIIRATMYNNICTQNSSNNNNNVSLVYIYIYVCHNNSINGDNV